MDIQALLELFRSPTTVKVAAVRLGSPPALIEGLVRQLHARGLLIQAEPGLGECQSGCQVCSMQNFCAKSETQQQDPPSQENKNPVWRLTKLGEQSVLENSA